MSKCQCNNCNNEAFRPIQMAPACFEEEPMLVCKEHYEQRKKELEEIEKLGVDTP